ncbi:MAG: hypothetical protein WC208_11890 [Gallionella sp.]|jgi:hypothetical protein
MYAQLASHRFFNVSVNASLGALTFSSETFIFSENHLYGALLGIVCIFLLSIHNFKVQSDSIANINQAEYWKAKFDRKVWLLNWIRRLIHTKTEIFREDIPLPPDFRDKSIKLIFQMIYQFYIYSHRSESPTNFRIIYQEPASDAQSSTDNYLKLKYWFYGDNSKPHYADKENEERRIFSLIVDPNHPEITNLSVKAYHSKKTEIYENCTEIPFHFDGQKEHVKSLISYPLKGGDSRSVLGVITISSDHENFFLRENISDHEEYLQEFGARAVMELTAKGRR